MAPEVEGLARAIAMVRILLQEQGYACPQRLSELEARLERGENDAVVTALSEAIGSAGSLRDFIIYTHDADGKATVFSGANHRLTALVREVEKAAREAAVQLGLAYTDGRP